MGQVYAEEELRRRARGLGFWVEVEWYPHYVLAPGPLRRDVMRKLVKEGLTLGEIGSRFNLSAQRVGQIVRKA